MSRDTPSNNSCHLKCMSLVWWVQGAVSGWQCVHCLQDNLQHCCEVHFLPAFFKRQGLAAQDVLALFACCMRTCSLGTFDWASVCLCPGYRPCHNFHPTFLENTRSWCPRWTWEAVIGLTWADTALFCCLRSTL